MIAYTLDLSTKDGPKMILNLTPGEAPVRLAKIVCGWFDEPLAHLIDPKNGCVEAIAETIRKMLANNLQIEPGELSEFLSHTASHRVMSMVKVQLAASGSWDEFYEFEGWKVFLSLGAVLASCYLINQDPHEKDPLVEQKMGLALTELLGIKCLLNTVVKNPVKFGWLPEYRHEETPSEEQLNAFCEEYGSMVQTAISIFEDLRYRLIQ